MESYSYGKADGGTLALENTDLSLKTNSNTSLLKWTKASYLISLSFSFLVLKKKKIINTFLIGLLWMLTTITQVSTYNGASAQPLPL